MPIVNRRHGSHAELIGELPPTFIPVQECNGDAPH